MTSAGTSHANSTAVELNTCCTCKNCGNLFAEVDTSVVLTSYPPQYNYYCPQCGRGGHVSHDKVYTRPAIFCIICGGPIEVGADDLVCERCRQVILKLRAEAME